MSSGIGIQSSKPVTSDQIQYVAVFMGREVFYVKHIMKSCSILNNIVIEVHIFWTVLCLLGGFVFIRIRREILRYLDVKSG